MALSLWEVQAPLDLATNALSMRIAHEIASSPYQLIISSWDVSDPNNASYIQSAKDNNDKLIIGYFATGVISSWFPEPSLFKTANLPNWAGNEDPDWKNIYSVKYWTNEWKEIVFKTIDKMVELGFDGIFFDVASSDQYWLPDNRLGNPPVADATKLLADLFGEIRDYIDTKHSAQEFYIIPNMPNSIAREYPDTLKKFDAIFNETLYFYTNNTIDNDVNNIVAKPADVNWTLQNTKAYNSANIPVFGNDYVPSTDIPNSFKSFLLYSSLGWPSSTQDANSSEKILVNGPFMFTATPAAPTVYGHKSGINFISAGITKEAFLYGGLDTANYFAAGSGITNVYGGSLNDTVYAHAVNVYKANSLIVELSSTIKANAKTPQVSILINDHVVLPAEAITAEWNKATQSYSFDVDSLSTIKKLELVVSNTSYVDQTNFSNVEINRIMLHGKEIDLAKGVFTSGLSQNGFTFSNTGTVTYDQKAFSDINAPVEVKTFVDGSRGLDTVIYEQKQKEFRIAQMSDGVTVSSEKYLIKDTLLSVERLKFTDTVIALDINGNAGQAYRLYQAALDRTPDQRGLADWINYMDNGGKLNAVSQMFIDSYEFRTKYGSLDNLSFVNQLYLNILDRQGEAQGVSDWTGALNGGAWTRAEVLVGFSESPENQAKVIGQIKNGIPYVEYWLT